MSYTTIDIVKKHLLENQLIAGRIEDEPLKLTIDAESKLKYPPVSEGSEKVKAREQFKPEYQRSSFAQEDEVDLNKNNLVRDSVVVATDSSLGTIFQENIDFSISHADGILSRLPDGNIPAGAEVSVWYVPYRVYSRGADYGVDYATGKISRISSGDLEAGQLVYVDYESAYARVDDEAIANAIDEANEQILNFIDSVYQSSSDRSLVVAETYLTVSIICRIKALGAISAGTKNAGNALWIGLADQYKKEAYLLLEKFVASIEGFKAPRRA